MAAKGREGLDLADRHQPEGRLTLASASRVIAKLNPPGRDGIAVDPGAWETSGIIDAT